MVALINFLRLLQLLSRAWRLVIPWIRDRITQFFMFLTVTTYGVFGNIPRALESIANEWRDRTQDRIGSTEFDTTLYHLFWWLALGMMVAGWIVISWLTMFIVHLIF